MIILDCINQTISYNNTTINIASQTIVSGIKSLKLINPNIKNHNHPIISVNLTYIILYWSNPNTKKKYATLIGHGVTANYIK